MFTDLAAPSASWSLYLDTPLKQSGTADRTHELVSERILIVILTGHIRMRCSS